jgi:hypothetical protein
MPPYFSDLKVEWHFHGGLVTEVTSFGMMRDRAPTAPAATSLPNERTVVAVRWQGDTLIIRTGVRRSARPLPDELDTCWQRITDRSGGPALSFRAQHLPRSPGAECVTFCRTATSRVAASLRARTALELRERQRECQASVRVPLLGCLRMSKHQQTKASSHTRQSPQVKDQHVRSEVKTDASGRLQATALHRLATGVRVIELHVGTAVSNQRTDSCSGRE